MEKRQTAAEREALRAAFLEQAAAQWNILFDPARQTELRTFDQREAQAVELARALGAKALEQRVRQDSEGPAEPTAPCPLCGKASRLRSTADDPPPPRDVLSRVGEIEYPRPEYYCVPCRRSFFPGGPRDGARDGGV